MLIIFSFLSVRLFGVYLMILKFVANSFECSSVLGCGDDRIEIERPLGLVFGCSLLGGGQFDFLFSSFLLAS